ncbi:MAG TPA: anthranilate synthase component I [Limnochordia bacterium]
MPLPPPNEFAALASKYNFVPVYEEVTADLDTPVSALWKLGETDTTFLLESVTGGEQLGRYSFVGNSAYARFSAQGKRVSITDPAGTRTCTAADPLDCLREEMKSFRVAPLPGLPRFFGGAVGYVAYDAVRLFERLGDGPPEELGLPDLYFVLTDTVLIFDHARSRLKVVVTVPTAGVSARAAYEAAERRIDAVLDRLARPLPAASAGRWITSEPPRRRLPAGLESNFTREDFLRAVERCREYIAAGDAFQIVLSQRLRVPFTAEPFDVYRALRGSNPSPYMYYLRCGDVWVVGSSPEVHVRAENGRAQLRPIAGTRPRGRTEAEDEGLERELHADEKERAEHVMLVDLARNDLGRVCEYGSVTVDELMVTERYSHVMHIVSNVTGRLRPDRDAFDLLRATFPAGTVSGAPKVRAMEIIDELEPSRRGLYAGAIAYFGFSGNMDSCIAIRTAVIKDGWAYVQAGAGIVADSVPEREYEESMNKAGAVLAALEAAHRSVRHPLPVSAGEGS